jgi:hypothetical protein
VVQLGRFLVRAVQRLPSRGRTALGRRVAFVPKRDAGFFRQTLDGFGELEVLDLAEELDPVATLTTPEAIEDALRR